jgi:hypothetical protein
MAVFWDIAPCNLIKVDTFQSTHRPDDGRGKHSETSLCLYALFQKSAIFIFAAVRAINFNKIFVFTGGYARNPGVHVLDRDFYYKGQRKDKTWPREVS